MKDKTTPKSVLIVEDDSDLLEMMGMVLEVASYRVTRASNGCEALAAVGKEMPGLILLDMKMPVMDGWEFASRFREQYDGVVPIVIVTAAADAGTRAAEIGAQGYLPKPFDINKLLTCVGKYLRPSETKEPHSGC